MEKEIMTEQLRQDAQAQIDQLFDIIHRIAKNMEAQEVEHARYKKALEDVYKTADHWLHEEKHSYPAFDNLVSIHKTVDAALNPANDLGVSVPNDDNIKRPGLKNEAWT